MEGKALRFGLAAAIVGGAVAGGWLMHSARDTVTVRHDAYADCIAMANASDFAGEVCESLTPGWVEPFPLRTSMIDTNGCFVLPFTFTHPGEVWGDPGDGDVYCVK